MRASTAINTQQKPSTFATMKLLLVSGLLLLLSILTVDGAAVYDISGNALKPGTPYYITSAIWGAGGGGLFPFRPQKICPLCLWCCPFYVGQKSSDRDKGLPVIVSPSDSSEEVVHLLIDVKIEFMEPAPDGGSPMWKLDSADSNGNRYVKLNGDPNNAINVNNWFKIGKAGEFGYKLLHCPSVAGTAADAACGNLGITSDPYEGASRVLALTDQSFRVVFVKA